MNIIVNGKDLKVKENITITELLEELKIKDKVMAVAINMEIVKKDNWQTHKIKQNDKLELLHFVGGG
jgi:sulfur carrier protein